MYLLQSGLTHVVHGKLPGFVEEKEGGDRNRPHTIDKGGRRKGILPTLGQGSIDALHEALESYLVGMMEDANPLAIHARGT